MTYEPYDKSGKKINIGDWVRLVEIPNDISQAPEETKAVFKNALGKTFKIENFNEYGLAELDLTKKVANFNIIWVEPHFLLLFRKKMSKKIIVYEKPTCTTCRNLANLLKENGIDYDKVNYFIEPLTEEKLRELLDKANLKPYDVLRTKEAMVKELNITKDTAPDEVIKLIIENPGILQRPIVEVGSRAVLARPIDKALDLINSTK